MGEAALKTLGSRIRERRKALSWTQEELADQAGLDRSYIGGVERGGRNLTFTVLRQIARALDCPVAELMVMSDPSRPGDGLAAPAVPDLCTCDLCGPDLPALDADARAAAQRLIAQPQGRALLRGFMAVRSPDLRAALLDLIRRAAGGSAH